MKTCLNCGGWFTGGPREPLRNALADVLCGACDLAETRTLFVNEWDWLSPTAMRDWWRELYADLAVPPEVGAVEMQGRFA